MKELDAFIEGVSGRFIAMGGDAALAVLEEVKERSASDLTDEDRQSLQDARLFFVIAKEHCEKAGEMNGIESAVRIMNVLDRLLGSK